MKALARLLRSLIRDSAALSQAVKRGTARRALAVARENSGALSLFLGAIVVSSGISIADPLIYREIIDRGILENHVPVIIGFALLSAGLAILHGALGLAQVYLAARIDSNVIVKLRVRLFEHVQRMPLAFFSRVHTGALVNRLVGDATAARSAFTEILSAIMGNLVTIALTIGTMFALSWRITLGTLVLVPFFILPGLYYGRRIQSIMRETFDASAAMTSLMIERFNIAGAILSRLFGCPTEDARVFEASTRRLSRANVSGAIYGQLFASVLVLTASLATALAYGWGGVLAARHVIDLGTVVALIALFARLYAPLMGLSSMQVGVMTALVAFERIFEVLDLVPTIQEKVGAVSISPGATRVSFEHVSFRYPSPAEISVGSLEPVTPSERETPHAVLDDITFDVDPGQLVALVGPSGAGKSTITHLIPRLYDVQRGVVRLNGIDVRDATFASLRERIGIVTQEAHLFHDTIRANLIYAKPDASEGEIRDALRDVQLLEIIDSLPQGLDTMVGEDGHTLSGGQKQRVALARLLLKSPDVVILDEATAHLDANSEAGLQQVLSRALTGRSVIVIAHRLSTVLRADQILVVQDGRIVQRGTHEQLIAAPGLYSELYRNQFFASTDRTELTSLEENSVVASGAIAI